MDIEKLKSWKFEAGHISDFSYALIKLGGGGAAFCVLLEELKDMIRRQERIAVAMGYASNEEAGKAYREAVKAGLIEESEE